MSVLVVAEHLRGQLRDVTRELSRPRRSSKAGRGRGDREDRPRSIDAVDIEGVDEIVTVEVDADEFENDVYQEAVEALIAERQPRRDLLGFTVNSHGLRPGGGREARARLRLRRPCARRRRPAASSRPAPSTAPR